MSRITKATEVTSAVIEELGTNIKVWQGMLKDAVESGDRALENSLRKEIKDAASELKKRSTALVPTDKPAKETTSIGLPKGQETEYFSKQLKTPVSRAENVTEQARINRAEAIKRGSAQGTGPTIEAEGTKALVPYKEPIFNPELMPKDDSVFSRVKDADIIDTTEVPSPVSAVQSIRDNKKLAMGAGLTATAASMTGSSPQNRAEQPAGLSDAQASQLGNDLLADINRPEAQAVAKLDRQAAKEKPKKPSSLKEAIAAASDGKAPSPAEPTPSPYEQSMAELKSERATAKAERDADLRRAEIGELASIIGQSLTQIGAAASGMRSGVDMSGIAQKALVDWDKRKDQVMNLYKQNVAELDGQQARLERAKERADDKVEKEAYQKAQMKLAKEKMQQDKDIAAQNNQLKILAAIATKNDKAIEASQAQYTRNLTKLDKRESDLRKVEELNILNKTKEVIAGELASLLGEESVKEEGWFGRQTVLSKDDLMKLVADKKAEIRQEREQVYKNLETLTAYQVRANAPKAEAPAPAAQASAGQPPSADDMVRVELEGKELRMPRANLQAAKNKYPNLKVLE